MISHPDELIFSTHLSFEDKAIAVFQFQYQNNVLYKRFVDALNCEPASVKTIEAIPFLPISFFKTHPVVTTHFQPQIIFSSSGTTGPSTSKHYVRNVAVYEQSFLKTFDQFFGSPADYCILGLLPSYLEREGSSLIYMVQKLMEQSGHPKNGFHLYDHDMLAQKLLALEKSNQQTILIGVTYALLDFAQAYPIKLSCTTLIETGGMKGRKKELLREEVHAALQNAFNVPAICAEYGMTELLSQAYSLSGGLFQTPPWMRVLVREEDNPLGIHASGAMIQTGPVNIIDLANLYSCSFIATDDLGRLYPNNTFQIIGRIDNSDIRGCSLLVV